ncbi:MAG: glutamate--tRNA ligase [Actinomycetota bacterium]
MSLRVRMAPAPSGALHVGNVRTFLFNGLYARRHEGVLVLRIEDTDRARFTEEAYEAALQDLRWIGLDWDEGPDIGGGYGPYRQSQRAELYQSAAMRLLESGAAYRCYCTPEELKQRREEAMAAGRPPGYDRRCYRLIDAEREAFETAGRPWAVRFFVPPGTTTFKDLVVGEVTVEHERIEDFVIMRSDGSTLYQLGVVVDDATMAITHVIRGDDHLSNTPKQILLHRAFGGAVPLFAHLPQVLGPDRRPLSKRHGSTSLSEFRTAGYLPEALRNYLALLGWGTAEDTILTAEELVARFDIEDVHPSPAIFDFAKLDWLNGEYIRALSDEELARRLEPFLARAGLVSQTSSEAERDLIAAVAPLIKTRIERLDQAADLVRGIFVDVDANAQAEVLQEPHVATLLDRAIDALEKIEPWNPERIEAALRGVQTEMGLKPKRAFIPFYVAVMGSRVAAPIFDSMALIGRERSLERLRRARRGLEGEDE